MAAPLRSWNLTLICQTLQGFRTSLSVLQKRSLTVTSVLRKEDDVATAPAEAESEAKDAEKDTTRKVVSPETSIRYLASEAYVQGYRGKPVWFYYRRNFKGRILPPTRASCIRQGKMSTASPCPICRDEYLVLHYQNIKLLEQFVSPYTGEVLDSLLTGLCQKQHHQLTIEVMRAWNEGLLEMKLPTRLYDYEDYKS
ncbi:hypothetical protein BsWGS_08615 [Bradybaena similaris]